MKEHSQMLAGIFGETMNKVANDNIEVMNELGSKMYHSEIDSILKSKGWAPGDQMYYLCDNGRYFTFSHIDQTENGMVVVSDAGWEYKMAECHKKG